MEREGEWDGRKGKEGEVGGKGRKGGRKGEEEREKELLGIKKKIKISTEGKPL